MTLLHNWRAVLLHAWSVRLDLIGVLLTALEFALQAFMDAPPISRGAFALVGMLITAASMGVRLLKQSRLSGEAE